MLVMRWKVIAILEFAVFTLLVSGVVVYFNSRSLPPDPVGPPPPPPPCAPSPRPTKVAPPASHEDLLSASFNLDDLRKEFPVYDSASRKMAVDVCDLVIVLTVWKRKALLRQLELIRSQTVLDQMGVCVLVFQNGHHLKNIPALVTEWRNPARWRGKDVDVSFVHSFLETGYYGRFLAPFFASKMTEESIFIICDDDVIWGRRYFENLVRVVREGFLAVRTGRYLSPVEGWELPAGEDLGACWDGFERGVQVTNEEDVLYDFGGHIWAGKVEWLRYAWKHPPIVIHTSEDLWLSVVLKSFYGIGTKKPKCPAPKPGESRVPEMCACSHMQAGDVLPVQVGTASVGKIRGMLRLKTMHQILEAYGTSTVFQDNPNHEKWDKDIHVLHDKDRPVFELKGTVFEECFFWV